MSEQLAREMHEIYENLAPRFGYVTRTDTREFDPKSSNGQLMIAVCSEMERRRQMESTRYGYEDTLRSIQDLEARAVTAEERLKVTEALLQRMYQPIWQCLKSNVEFVEMRDDLNAYFKEKQ